MNLRFLTLAVIVFALVGMVWAVNRFPQQPPAGSEPPTKQEPEVSIPTDANPKQEPVPIPLADTDPEQEPVKWIPFTEIEHPTVMSIDRIDLMLANLKRIVEGKKRWEEGATILEQSFGIEAIPALYAVMDYHRDTDAILRCQECVDVIMGNLGNRLENGRSPVNKKHERLRDPMRNFMGGK